MGRIGIEEFRRWKREGRRFVCLTAYDAVTARILEAAGVPMLLVGDSLGNVILGYRDTVPVGMEEMLHHAAAARRGAPSTFTVGDMPFLSYQVSSEEAVRNAGRFLKEGGMDAVKIEGGGERRETVSRLVEAGIPVMGHLGLTPQSATLLGGYRVQGTAAAAARRILQDAVALEQAGVFSLVLECVPRELAKEVTRRLSIPTIGIGAGPECDAQVLVLHDLLGLGGGFSPRFVRRYASLEDTMTEAVQAFCSDVSDGSFPGEKESFHMPAEELGRFQDECRVEPSKDAAR
ncbi:MAG: 3-methyl-2-oxobutanoate hydroxymethyltransferase [Planctomycetota bacterium]